MRRFYLIFFLLVTGFAAGRATVTVDDGERWWGHSMNVNTVGNYGTGTVETYDVAVYLPAHYATRDGGTVRALRFWLWSLGNISNVKVWASAQLPAVADDADIQVVSVPGGDLVGYASRQMNEVAFGQPVAIPEGGLYVGYSFSVDMINYDGDTDNKFPVATVSSTQGIGGSAWLRTSSTQPDWADLSSSACWAVQLLLGNGLVEHGARAVSMGRGVAVRDGQTTVPVVLTQMGTQGLHDIDYVLTDPDGDGGLQHMDLDVPFDDYGRNTTIAVPMSAGDVTGLVPYGIKVTAVNGHPNEVYDAYQQAVGGLLTIDQAVRRRTLIEEFTGTWCGYCPRGIAGMRLAKQQFGDDVIVVCAHYGDVMAIDGYQPLINESDAGFPSCFLNRSSLIDPYWGSTGSSSTGYALDSDIARQQEQAVEADLQVVAVWSDDSQTRIDVTATATFYYDNADAPYALAYVLVADSLSGSGSNWYQRNYLHGSESAANDPNLREFAEASSTMRNVQYHDVAVAAYDILNGIDGSISAPLVSGEGQEHAWSIGIDDNTLVKDKQGLRVVAMLIDRLTGLVVNAAEAHIGDHSGVTMASHVPAVTDHKVYDLQGRQAASLQRGINIVRDAYGSTHKVYVR